MVPFDEFLLPCNIPIVKIKPRTVFKHLVSSPPNAEITTYFTALPKHLYWYNTLLFNSAKVISFIAKSEQNSEHKSTHLERELLERHKSSSRSSPTTTDKMPIMLLSLRTLEAITENLKPYDRPNDTPLTTPTRLLDYYERIYYDELLPSLILEPQIINQFSPAIQSTFEPLNPLISS